MLSQLVCFVVVGLLSLSALADDVPIQHRIALLPDGMTVSWSTQGPASSTPEVRYGKDANSMTSNAQGFTAHYDSSITWFHHVELHQLDADTQFFWQVVTPDNSTSPIYSFRTQPDLSKGQSGAFTVAIYGDMGIDNSDNTLRLLRNLATKQAVDLFFHVGDLSYADDHASTDLTYEQIQEGWMNNMTDHIWTETPYMFTPGNHEHAGGKNSTHSQLNFTSYRTRFHMPPRADEIGDSSNMYYSFDYGLMHFIAIDTEATFPDAPEGKDSGPFGDQAAWLRADLKQAVANQDKVPWIIIGGHRPFFTTGGAEKSQLDFFLPIIQEFESHIAAIFVGHIHWYERLYALRTDQSICSMDYQQPDCPVYIVTGAAGNIEGLSKFETPKNITAKLISEYGIGILKVVDQSTLQWNFIDSQTQKVIDSIVITKDNTKFASE